MVGQRVERKRESLFAFGTHKPFFASISGTIPPNYHLPVWYRLHYYCLLMYCTMYVSAWVGKVRPMVCFRVCLACVRQRLKNLFYISERCARLLSFVVVGKWFMDWLDSHWWWWYHTHTRTLSLFLSSSSLPYHWYLPSSPRSIFI